MIKTLGFTTVFGLFAYGQAELPLSGWSNLPAMGLLMFLLWWILTKQQPKERKDAQTSAAQERKEAREHTERVVEKIGADFKAIQKQQHEDQRAMIGQIGILTEHCTQARSRETPQEK